MVIRAHLKAFRGFNHWHPAVVAVDYITEIHNAFMAVGRPDVERTMEAN